MARERLEWANFEWEGHLLTESEKVALRGIRDAVDARAIGAREARRRAFKALCEANGLARFAGVDMAVVRLNKTTLVVEDSASRARTIRLADGREVGSVESYRSAPPATLVLVHVPPALLAKLEKLAAGSEGATGRYRFNWLQGQIKAAKERVAAVTEEGP